HGDVHHIARKRFAGTKLKILELLGSRFTAVSRFSADRLAELGIDAGRITALPNPIPPPQRCDEEKRAHCRASLGVTSEWNQHWLWIHVANIRPVKDQETLIRGFARAKEIASHKQSLCIVGDGDGRPALEKLADQFGLGDSIRWLGFRDDVPLWLTASDGFLLSSRSEAMPMSLLEGMAARLYPISTDVGGVAEVIGDDEGRLVPPGDHDALGRAMAAAVDCAEVSRESARRSAARVRNDYSVEALTAKYKEIYRDLLGG
ncbi:MAG: glycosyltransferase, partial [bacterium]|nr:glycosyltransferase [bacterium]